MKKIKIDMNDPVFQENLFRLEKHELHAFIRTLEKISHLTWDELYKHPGLQWEAILSKKTDEGNRLYSFRFSKKYRGTAECDGNFMRLFTLSVDHDSAYE